MFQTCFTQLLCDKHSLVGVKAPNAAERRQRAVGSGGVAAGDEGVGALGLGVGHSPAQVARDAASTGGVEGAGVAAEVVGSGLVLGAGPGGRAVGGGGDLRGQLGLGSGGRCIKGSS